MTDYLTNVPPPLPLRPGNIPGREMNKLLNFTFFVGHLISEIPEIPLVVRDKAQEVAKTKEAVDFLKKTGAWSDVLKVRASKSVIIIIQLSSSLVLFAPLAYVFR